MAAEPARTAVEMDRALSELTSISVWAGRSLHLVQAGGGNASVKVGDGGMLIKASGIRLAEVTPQRGIVPVDCGLLRGSDVDLARLARWNAECATRSGPRPSMEVSLHAFLDRVVLHTHPLIVNAFVCAVDGQRAATRALDGVVEYLYVPYAMPGVELGGHLWRAVVEHRRRGRTLPSVVFLENHGLVVHGATGDDVVALTDRVVTALAKALPLAASEFALLEGACALSGELARALIAAVPERPAHACLAAAVNDINSAGCLFPDVVVFCGPEAVSLRAEYSQDEIQRAVSTYVRRWGQMPRTWRIAGRAVCTGASLAEARGSAEVWWAHAAVERLTHSLGGPRYLTVERVQQLLVSDAEAYRRDLAAGSGSMM